ncbi:hypothetical protein DLN15_24745 [Salmonella enterica subsp. enterica serovar Newport]|nr:hypothetical protein DLN15_24745 [Salmonella enterica subsp. enterica serovar Newport]
MNRKVLALLVPALLVAGAAKAAEGFNKKGKQIDLFGTSGGLRYFSFNVGDGGEPSSTRIWF